MLSKDLFSTSVSKDSQVFKNGRGESFVLAWMGIQDDPSPNGLNSRRSSYHEAILRHRNDRLLQSQLSKSPMSGDQFFLVKKEDGCQSEICTYVESLHGPGP